MEDEGVEYRQTSAVGETEHTAGGDQRQRKAWLFNDLTGRKNNGVLNTGFDRKPVYSTKNRRYVATLEELQNEADSIILKYKYNV